MKLKEIYKKPIDRDIKGVVKVGQDDQSNIYQELDEYVLTEELSKHFSTLFENYKKGITSETDKMGVWISGFFGSGKSHFLKILSYLLENKEVNGKKAIDFFDDKIQDPMVLADMKKAGDITTDIALFNIENKSESNEKDYKDAILRVFNKVFDEMQGFCGSSGWVADLERQLVKEGLYEEFKVEFEEECGTSWLESREDIYYEEDAVVNALIKVRNISEESARNWFNKAEANYSMSIEKFAKRVAEYIESKGNNHHVIFLVDEIGQYIGDDTKLMLNLQGIVEELGTYCKGKCWVMVTSQQVIDSITEVKGNDFSKIQGRFNTRLKLSSANVDEVIKKRLLSKTEGSQKSLELLYEQKSAILKNLITFTRDTAEMKVYENERDFAQTYPFIPYQFNLLQKVFQGIRGNAASEKHMSEGERSLLGSFQETAMKFMDYEVGALIPFSAFYKTIESFLDSNIRSVIIQASKNNELKEFDIEILKLLFLLKYVKEIKANVENMTTLMASHIDEDKIETEDKIKESLRRLISQTLIQQNGEEYIFLANDEQDVNRDIKKTFIETKEILEKLGKIVFEEIYRSDKFRYPKTKKDFIFNKYVDEQPIKNSSSEIGIRIITPYNDLGGDMSQIELKNISLRENNVIVKINSTDISFISEIEESLQIIKYIRMSSKSTPNIEIIKTRKASEKEERENRAKTLIKEALKSAEIYVGGALLDIKEKEAEARLNEGMKSLIDSVYPKFSYIKKPINSVDDIATVLDNKINNQIGLTKEDEEPNKNAIEEVYDIIDRSYYRNISITIKTILTTFSKSPYGWDELDIIEKIAKLFKEQKIKLEYSGENISIENKDLINYITKKAYTEKVKIKVRETVPQKQIDEAKRISKEVFLKTIHFSDEDNVMNQIKENAKDELFRINNILSNYKMGTKYPYPEKDILITGKETIEEILNIKDPIEFFNESYKLRDDFYDYGDYSLDVRDFFKDGSKQKITFDEAVEKIKHYEENKEYADDSALEIVQKIKKIIEKKKPYSEISNIPKLIEDYNEKFVELLEKEAERVKPRLEEEYNQLISILNQYEFKDMFKASFDKKFEDLRERLSNANNFTFIVAIPTTAERIKIQCVELLEKEQEKRNKEIYIEKETTKENEITKESVEKVIIKTQPKSLYKSSLLTYNDVIESEEDVEKIVKELRETLLKELKEKGKLRLI